VFYRYKVHDAAGDEIGEAHYAVLIQPGADIVIGAGRKMRVLSVIAVEEEDSPYVGLLQVEAVG
jgi:hypothetical protein